uniref:Pyridine nucleotide-disulfide oxidoreductase domain-containing protein 1 n=1 Tax=Strigamia maritima TaxID=126957 RepID=T1JPI4_STRMM
MPDERVSATYVVVGGGIAGVSCAECLSYLASDEPVLLISASPLIKTVSRIQQVTQLLEELDVEEKPMETLMQNHKNLSVISDKIVKLNSKERTLLTASGAIIEYEKLCIATGGKPKIISELNEFVIGIRDTETTQTLQKKLSAAKRVVVVGNGGIATELVYEIENCRVIWVIKDKSISATFFDPGAAEFFLPNLSTEKAEENNIAKRMKYTIAGFKSKVDASLHGSALGPDWATGLKMSGDSKTTTRNVEVQYSCEVETVLSYDEFKTEGLKETIFDSEDAKWPVYVRLTNGKIFGCDFIVSATGVTPDCDVFLKDNEFAVSEDGALKVDSKMETSIKNIFAAGDVCNCSWELPHHWFQMRLWTQARQMGCYVAKCLIASVENTDVSLDFCFEMFTHVTKFFGFKVVLLGLFNGQKLGTDYDIILRMTKGKEYIKLVMQNGRIQGAILIGETDLEETFENLILNQMDLSRYGENLLDPNIDIEDYFD